MTEPGLNRLCRMYLMGALLTAAVLSPQPYPPVAFILVLAMLSGMLHPSPRFDIVSLLGTLFLLPLMLASFLPYVVPGTSPQPVVVQVLSVIAALPTLRLLDRALRQNAPSLPINPHRSGRLLTPVSRALFTAAGAALLVSLILDNRVLLFTGIAFALYLVAVLLLVIKKVPDSPVSIPLIEKRIIAHASGDCSLSAAASARLPVHCSLTPVVPWVSVDPSVLTLDGAAVTLIMSVTPPLAGPTRPGVRVSVVDQWGFLQTNQLVEPVELQVIPRARYAEWLAMKFLEQTGTRVGMSAALSADDLPKVVGGAEYYGSRDYQPGDRLKDIDWRHTLKLQQIITKERTDAGRQSAIIAVNLSVADAEGADRLAFDLITTALTLAQQAIPTALTSYNDRAVIATVPPASPEETVKQTLAMVRDIALVAVPKLRLQPPDVRRLRRSMSQLKRAESGPARRLLDVLDLEYRAIDAAARNSPATLALTRAVRQVMPPAMVILISQYESAPEALAVMTEKLEERGFTTLRMGNGD